MKTFRSLLLAFLVLCPLSGSFELWAQTRDRLVVVDCSGSMQEGAIIEQVKAWVVREVLPRLANGDRFSLMSFGREPRWIIRDLAIQDHASRARLERELAGLAAVEHFTDLGRALEAFAAAMDDVEGDGDIAWFITDGRNAPPDWSPWYGRELRLDAHFQAIGKKIALKGWSVYVVGLGSETDASVVAEAIPGSTLVEGAAPLEDATLSQELETGEKIDLPAADLFRIAGILAAIAAAFLIILLIVARRRRGEG